MKLIDVCGLSMQVGCMLADHRDGLSSSCF